MKLTVNGVVLEFENYKESSPQTDDKRYRSCDAEGKELVWKTGQSGYFEYSDGARFNGKRTEVYKMDSQGVVIPKNERTIEINTETDCKKKPIEFMNKEIVPVGEKICLNDRGVFKGLTEKECMVLPVQLAEGGDKNTKLGVIYKDEDGFVTLRLGSTELKSKQKQEFMEKIKAKDAIKKISAVKRVTKKATVSI